MNEQDIRGGLPSASSFFQDVACPGRQNLLRELRERLPIGSDPVDNHPMAELAARGTRLHQTRATGHTLHLKDEGEAAAYRNGVLLEAQLVNSWMQDFGIKTLPEPILEERYWLHHPLLMSPMLSGQADAVFVSPPHAAIWDWKSGSAHYVPPANSSWQLRVYAVLVWREYKEISHVRVAYVMPERFGEKLDFCDLSLFDLQRIEHEIFQVLWRSQQPDAELNAGTHCRFCAARGICPAAAKMATLPAVTGNGDPLALVRAMPVADLAVVFKKKALVTQIFEAITTRLSALSDDELDAIGLKRTQGRKLDTIKDTVSAFCYLKGNGMSESDLLTAMSFEKGKLVKLLANTRGVSQDYAAQLLDTQLDQFIERDRAKPSIIEKPK